MSVTIIKQAVILLLLSCLLLTPAIHAQWNDRSLEEDIQWINVLQTKDISISIGEWPGSEFAGFRSETVFSTTLHSLVNLIKDIESYCEWMPDCDESRLLTRSGESGYIYYVSMKSPWPLDDRYWVNKLEIQSDPERASVSVIFRSVDGYLPEKENMVRVQNHFALWRLTEVAQNRVHSIWYAHSEPGGIIPPWAVRQTYDQIILETTRNMIDRVQLKQKP